MFKHRLMLSVATVALISSPALAVGPTTISTKTTDPLKTSTSGNITIDASGSIEASTATPLITIDSSNTVVNNGKLVDKNTASATAYLIDATGGPLTGSLTDTSTLVDLTGTGDTKRLVDLKGGVFNGSILFNGAAYNITGDNSIGYLIDSGSTLNGSLTAGGVLTLNPTSAGTTASSSGLIGIDLLGTINGDVTNAGTITAYGNNSRGIVVGSTSFTGTLANTGVIQIAGIATRDTKKVNPEGGSAITINSTIGGGFINGIGAQLLTLGTAPVVQVTPTGVTPIVLGAVPTTVSATNTFGYGFMNFGTISGAPEDNNQLPTIIGVSLGGSTSPLAAVVVNGGLLNEGIISGTSTSLADTNTPVQPSHAIGLFVGSYATIPVIDNIGLGVKIQGIVGGPADGGSTTPSTGTGLYIDANASVPTINNLAGASIIGAATTPDTSISALQAFGIEDFSGTVTTINNSGTISATATTLDANNQITTAIDVSHSGTGVTINDGDPLGTFTNHFSSAAAGVGVGVIQGDIKFGSGNDTLNISGATVSGSPTQSTVTGNLYYGAATAGFDALNVNNLGTFTGGIISTAGNLNINVATGGAFNLNDTSLGVQTLVNKLDLATGTTFNLTVAPGLAGTGVTRPGIVSAADEITLAHGSLFSVSFGGFVPSTSANSTPFVLLDAPGGALTIPDAQSYINAFTTPFLFTGDLCTVNVNVATDCPSGTFVATTHSQLVLSLTQKTAADLNLTGYAAQMYPLANKVLPLDTTLGGAVLIGSSLSTPANSTPAAIAASDAINEAAVQSIYDQFAPIATGSARAIAISLTDQATGAVAARQRQLRLYGKQPGESTMWGIEYAQFLKDPGSTDSPATGIPAGPLSGYKDHGFGFSIGGDGGDAKGGWYGAALTFYTGDAGELGSRTGNTQSEWYMASGYTDWRGRGLFFDSNLNVGLAQFKGKRNIDIDLGGGATFDRTAMNKHTGLLVGGGITTGAMLNFGGTTIAPQFSLDALTMREEGYTEQGGGTPGADAVDLMVKPSYGTSLRGFFGTDLREDIDTGSFFLQPSARVGYRYDFVDGAQKVNANFVGDGTAATMTPFSVVGPDPDRGNFVASLGIGATTDTWSLNVSYDFVRGSSGAMQQNGQFTLVGRI